MIVSYAPFDPLIALESDSFTAQVVKVFEEHDAFALDREQFSMCKSHPKKVLWGWLLSSNIRKNTRSGRRL